MKIIIAGAGAVGGYYGGMLAHTGHDVFFIARGTQLAALRERGLAIKSIDGDFALPSPKCGENADSFGYADLILVCFKTYDTAKTLDLYKAGVGPQTAIISLQNGVDNEDIIAGRYGAEKVLGGVTFIGSRVESPGVILHTAASNTIIGELDGGVYERVKTLGDVFERAGVKCKVSGDIKRDMWGKTIWNIGFNAICSILECSAQEAIRFEETRQIVRAAMLEWIAVAQAVGVGLTPDMADKHIERTFTAGEIIPSMLQDKRVGRRMEIDTFNGKAVELGLEYGVETPVNKTLTVMIRFWNERN
jgi:2-dehydropantoate 2-reductase